MSDEREKMRDDSLHDSFMKDVYRVHPKKTKPKREMTVEEAIKFLELKGLLPKKEEEKKE